MKNLKKRIHIRIHLKSKHLLVIMTLFCVSGIVTTFASGVTVEPLQSIAGFIVVPFEKSISRISASLTDFRNGLREKEEILQENEQLKLQIETLTEQNNKLLQDQTELARLQEMYNLDEEYSDYPKVAASVISKDPGNWYDTFMINRGSKDGIRVDNNVIAMAVSTSDTCVVKGDLELIDEGKLRFEQLYDQEGKVTVGERIVTSNISEKYVEGLFIGYVNEVEQDTNNLTKTGTIVTPVDFQHIREVFVITVNKADMFDAGNTASGDTESQSSEGE